MTLRRYRVYYEYRGPTKGDPFRSLKNPDQIRDALDRVEVELAAYLDDRDARIEATADSENSILLTVEASDSADMITKALEKCLGGLDLFGTSLS